MLRERLAL
jgi:hypothetical protein